MSKQVYIIEGLDRLGKSTLIEGIRDKLGYYEVIHFSKPPKVPTAYTGLSPIKGVPAGMEGVYTLQRESFLNAMLLARSGARVIFDRSWVGEAVYAPMYRGYSGDYVFQQELDTGLADTNCARLILLWEDFEVAKHFVDDGESLGKIEDRQEQQWRFMAEFEKSNIRDKRLICVTDQALGGFKPKNWILHEALA